jgi:hypothetical protein
LGVQASSREYASHVCGGLVLFPTQFWVGVEVPTDFNQSGGKFGGNGMDTIEH